MSSSRAMFSGRHTWAMLLVALAILFAEGVSLQAQNWEEVVPGIDYGTFRFTSPQNDVFVTRLDRSSTAVIVDSSLANGRISQANVGYNAETIPAQVARYDGAFGYWGRETARFRYKVVAAINGNGFSTANGCPDSAMAMNGALIKRTFGPTSSEVGGAMGFLYKIGGAAPTPGFPYMGGDLYLPPDRTKNRLSFVDGSWLQFNALNDQPRSNAISLYTHHYGVRTPVASNVLEVVVRLDNSAPFRILPWSNYVRGTVTDIRAPSNGQTPIPFDSIVAVASGNQIANLSGKIPVVGTEVRFSQETSDTSGVDWTNMYTAIGPMWGVILRNGVKPTTSSPGYHTDVHPRTAVAFNASYIYFIVVDGRSGRSSGMTLSALADFCGNSLDASDAVNLDGGGSSTMWVDGQIRNVPSDGSPRPVANGLMMIQLEPKELSEALQAGSTAFADSPTGALFLSTGPGQNFHNFTAVANNTQLTIVEHHLNGLRAQDTSNGAGHWWKVRTPSDFEGWVLESSLNIPQVLLEGFSIH